MEFDLSADQVSRELQSRKFAQEELAEVVHLFEYDSYLRQRFFADMGKKGYLTLSISKNDKGRQTADLIMTIKEISKVDAGIGIATSVTNMVADAIDKFGTSKQKEKYLPGFASGIFVPAAFALTEKNAGSDPKNLSTAAELDLNDDDYYWINGEKQFITNGDIAGVLIVFARTREGITAFLIDGQTEGMSVSKIENKLGLLSINLTDLTFDNCRIHRDQILGTPGQGLSIALSSLDGGRLGVAAQALGIAEAAYQKALEYSKSRVQFGKPIVDNQAIAFKLADMHVKINAANLLLKKGCWLRDQKMPYTLAASEAKLFASEIANEVASDALQIFGGYGYVKDFPLEKYFRDARVTTLYEGTSEIQRIVIAREILR